MQVVFRVDASLDIGTGHAMRCITLADVLRERGALSRFVCRAHAGHLVDTIRGRGFEVDELTDPGTGAGSGAPAAATYEAWLGVDWATDAAQTAAVLDRLPQPADWLVVDHYSLDARWEAAIGERVGGVAVIDDLAERRHRCDMLLDQNIGRTAAAYSQLLDRPCEVFAGPAFALLRPEFAALRASSLRRRVAAPVERLLISLGGVDRDNATGAVIAGLAHCGLPPELFITVVMGSTAPWRESVEQLLADLPWKAELRVAVHDMAQLMADADLAIGAAGTTTWERSCLGLPSLVILTADNQRYVVGELEARDLAVVAHQADLLQEPARLGPLMRRLVERRDHYGAAAAALTDGRGAVTVADYLLARPRPGAAKRAESKVT